MNELFKNQGKDSQRRGHSVMAPSSRLGFGNSRHNWKDAGSNNLGIINENKKYNILIIKIIYYFSKYSYKI